MTFDDYVGATATQRQFYAALIGSPRARVLYGGAGGGGKSWGLRYSAVQLALAYSALGFGGQRIVLACADYPRLRDRHIGKFSDEYRQFGVVKTSSQHGLGFHFYNEDYGVIALRNLQDPNRFRGSECSAMLIDEATELPETIDGYDIMFTLNYPLRSNKAIPFMPLGMTSNPDGIGHKWVKSHFITREALIDDVDPSRYKFVPALPTDNPYIQESWINDLQNAPDHIRASRLYGSWDAPEGARWNYLNKLDQGCVFETAFPQGVPSNGFSIIGIDWGSRAPYAAVWFYVEPGGANIYAYREDYQTRLTYDEQAGRVVALTGINERIKHVRADPAMWQKPSDPATGEIKPSAIEYFDRILGETDRFPRASKGYNQSRVQGHMTLDMVLRRDNPFPNLWIDVARCPNLWSELESAVFDTRTKIRTSEELDPRCADHAITATIYALHAQIHATQIDTVSDWLPSAAEMDEFNRLRLRGSDYDDYEPRIPAYLRSAKRF